MRTSICILIFVLLGLPASYAGKKGKVLVLPSLHRFHRQNPHYSYDSLRTAIEKFHPDIVAVEMRAEDVERDTAYQKKNYPYEMWMMQRWFPKVKIAGFDWVGDDLAGQPIPEGYWDKTSPVKQWEKEMWKNPVVAAMMNQCDSFNAERLKLLTTLSLTDLLKSNDAWLTQAYYGCLEYKLKGTEHYRVVNYYRERDKHLLNNLKELIAKNPKKKILIVCGDDHYPYLKELNK